MYGKSFKRCSVLLVLLLCSPSLFSQPSAVEIDPLGIYEISGAQLIALQTERIERETIINELSTRIETQSADCETAITDLETSSLTSLDRAQSAERRAGMFRSLSIVLGTTTVGGVLFILFTVFGR